MAVLGRGRAHLNPAALGFYKLLGSFWEQLRQSWEKLPSKPPEYIRKKKIFLFIWSKCISLFGFDCLRELLFCFCYSIK